MNKIIFLLLCFMLGCGAGTRLKNEHKTYDFKTGMDHALFTNLHSASVGPSIPIPDNIKGIELFAGGHHTCALITTNFGQQVNCNGRNIHGELNFQSANLGHIRQITLGEEHACVLSEKGISCWGNSKDGRTNIPSELLNRTQISKIAAHADQTCALADGKVYCWGLTGATVPEWLTDATDIAVGGRHACAVTMNSVSCWGDNPQNTIVPDRLKNPKSIVAGRQHTCALVDTGVVCWGSGTDGQNNYPNHLNNVHKLVAGGYHTCAIGENDFECWGWNKDGQATTIGTWKEVQSVAAGVAHTCAITSAGLECRGVNQESQFDLNLTAKRFKSVDIKTQIGCAIENESLTCWGESTFTEPIPKFLKSPKLVKLSDDGSSGCVATVEDIQCWFSYDPKYIREPIQNVKELVVDNRFACAIYDENKISCFGNVPRNLSTLPQTLPKPRLLAYTGSYLCLVNDNDGSICYGDSSKPSFKPYYLSGTPDLRKAIKVDTFKKEYLCFIVENTFACGFVSPTELTHNGSKCENKDACLHYKEKASISQFDKPLLDFMLNKMTNFDTPPCVSRSGYDQKNCKDRNVTFLIRDEQPIHSVDFENGGLLERAQGFLRKPSMIFRSATVNRLVECAVDDLGIFCLSLGETEVVKNNPFKNGRN